MAETKNDTNNSNIDKVSESHCLITVGTTEFNNLMLQIDNDCDKFLDVLKHKGINCLTIQKGRGKYVPNKIKTRNKELNNIMSYINVIEYTSSGQEFQELIKKSSLIISHAGAGSILESLRMEKKIFVVNNDTLMHNHQLEICKPLAKGEYLYYSPTVKEFIDILKICDFSKLIKYPPPDYNAFPKILNKFLI
eukprot:524993_1